MTPSARQGAFEGRDGRLEMGPLRAVRRARDRDDVVRAVSAPRTRPRPRPASGRPTPARRGRARPGCRPRPDRRARRGPQSQSPLSSTTARAAATSTCQDRLGRPRRRRRRSTSGWRPRPRRPPRSGRRTSRQVASCAIAPMTRRPGSPADRAGRASPGGSRRRQARRHHRAPAVADDLEVRPVEPGRPDERREVRGRLDGTGAARSSGRSGRDPAGRPRRRAGRWRRAPARRATRWPADAVTPWTRSSGRPPGSPQVERGERHARRPRRWHPRDAAGRIGRSSSVEHASTAARPRRIAGTQSVAGGSHGQPVRRPAEERARRDGDPRRGARRARRRPARDRRREHRRLAAT